MPTKKVHIMDSVDFLDRINIHVFQVAPGHFNVDFTAKEKGKVVVLDTDAKEKMSRKITELCADKNANHPNLRGYIEEYVGRLVREFHKVDLAVIENTPNAIEDHYSKLRKLN